MQKLLFATDFSDSAKEAVATINFLREKQSSECYLIHVVASFWKNWLSSGMHIKEAMQRLTSWQQMLNEDDPTKLKVTLGNVAEQVVIYADEVDADLIVLGSKIKQGGRYKAGSTIEGVTRAAKQSVLVCHTQEYNRIICGIDGSDASMHALNQAIHYCELFNAELVVIHALPNVGVSLGEPDSELHEEESEFKLKQSSFIESLLSTVDFKNVPVETCYLWGKPSHALLDTAEDRGADLIVVGATGQSLLQHVMIGSTAEKVIRFAPCSVLVTR